MAACALPVWFTQNIVFELSRNDKTKQTMMGKGITTFKHSYRLTFSRLYAKLRPTAMHKCDAIICLFGYIAEEGCMSFESLPALR